jgi:hypothetical protein
MPLITPCPYNNPLVFPEIPMAAGALNLAPAQGDHVFGDVVGAIGTALMYIFGGGQNLPKRMSAYNSTLARLWNGLSQVNLGHAGAGAPVVMRTGPPERDQHAHMFGGYANRLQWQLREIVCTGFATNGAEVRSIGGSTVAWRTQVLAALDALLNNLVDTTAINAYITAPNTIRQADPKTVVHAPMSLAKAVTVANATNGPGQANVKAILTRYQALRGTVDGILRRFDGPVKRFNPQNDTWS